MSMEKILGKISLYDVLAMIIPGGTILFFFQILFADNLFFSDILKTKIEEGCPTLLFIIVAYIIGIFNHLLANEIWEGFRNNSIILKATQSRVLHEIKNPFYLWLIYESSGSKKMNDTENPLIGYLKGVFWFLWAIFLACAILSMIIFRNLAFYVYDWVLLVSSVFLIIFVLFIFAVPLFTQNEKDSEILDAYYNAYYYVQQNYKNGDISILEGQVAFLESMFLPIFLFLCLPYECVEKYFMLSYAANTVFLLKCLVAILWVGILPTIISRIEKIHELVWENYEYLKRL